MDDEPKDIATAPAEEKARIREMLRAGKLDFAPGVREQMIEMGLTEDDITAALMNSLGLDG